MTTFTNPYRTPQPAAGFIGEDTEPASRLKISIWLLAYLYPVWLTSSFYVTWLIAWVQLNHRPRPLLDDPKFIGGLMDIANFVPGLLLMAMPVLAPLGLGASFFNPFRTAHSRRFALDVAILGLYLGLCTTALLILRADPWRVVEWWFD